MKERRENSLVKNGMLVFAAQMLVNVCNFGFHSLVSRRVGVAAYGTLNALVSAFQILVVPALIFTTLLVKYAADLHARDESGRLRSLLAKSMRVLGLVALLVFLAGAALSGPAAAFFNTENRLAVILMLAILCFNLVLPIRGILQGLEAFKPYSVSLTVEALVKVILAAAFTFVGWGVDGALGGWLLGCVVALAFTWGIQWSSLRTTEPQAVDLDLRSLLATGGTITLAMLCVTSLGFSDVVLVKHYFAPDAAGLYGAAALAGKMLYFLVYFVPAVVLPRVATSNAKGKATGKILLVALVVVFAFGGAGEVLYYCFPSAVVEALAGRAFAAAAPLVFPYGAAATLLAALNVAVTYKIGLSRYEFVAPLAVVAGVQVAAIAYFHQSPLQIIGVLAACDAAALVAVILPLGRPAEETSSLSPATQRSPIS